MYYVYDNCSCSVTQKMGHGALTPGLMAVRNETFEPHV
jgi:hypothetical protein